MSMFAVSEIEKTPWFDLRHYRSSLMLMKVEQEEEV
jgi:hypothetical protein